MKITSQKLEYQKSSLSKNGFHPHLFSSLSGYIILCLLQDNFSNLSLEIEEFSFMQKGLNIQTIFSKMI